MKRLLAIAVVPLLTLLAACPPTAQTPAAEPVPEQPAAAEPTEPAHVGAKLAGAEVVEAAQLIGAPDKYQGKVVQVQGTVKGFCHHKRNWFALEIADPPGAYLRVITEPAFLVPGESIGKKVRTEGTVEVVEISAGTAAHYAADHKLGQTPEGEAPVKQVVLRARGAEFM